MKRPLLAPLMPLYAAAVWLRGIGYDRKLLAAGKLQYPVISVGNISTGGAGKTPFVIALAELLKAEGIAVDVLSRGYRRESKITTQVATNGTVVDYGDEPLMIARTASVPVYVGSKRFEAGTLAEKRSSNSGKPSIHLLDDGFQHRQLWRAIDIVLVNRSDLEDSLLPAGNLREPLSALKRADILVVRKEEEEIIPDLRRRGFEQPLGLVQRMLTIPTLEGPALAFCGIARPEDFFAGLRQNGLELAAQVAFPDHHGYGQEEANRLADLALRHKAAAFLTTAKDHIKLDQAFLETLEKAAPVYTVDLKVRILEEKTFLRNLLSRLGI